MTSTNNRSPKILVKCGLICFALTTSFLALGADQIKAIEFESNDSLIFVFPKLDLNGNLLVVFNAKFPNNTNIQRPPTIKVTENTTEYYPVLEKIESKNYATRAMYLFKPYNVANIRAIEVDGLTQKWVIN